MRRLIPVMLWLCSSLAACGAGPERLRDVFTGPVQGLAAAEMEALMAAGADRMVLRIPRLGLAVTMVKASERDGVIRWRSTDNAQILTRDGRIIATRGLGHDLMSSDPGTLTDLIRAAESGRSARIDRLLDGEDRTAIRSYICDVAPAGAERIRVGESAYLTALRVEETCHRPTERQLNRFWVLNGEILQAEQVFNQELGPVTILYLP